MAEINVTPLVDVMLVLLIIFMVTAPLLVAGVPVDLPDSRAGALDQEAQAGPDRDRRATARSIIDDAPVADAALAARLAAIAAAAAPSRAARASTCAPTARLDYGRVMRVMGEINRAGLSRVALVSVGRGANADGPRRSDRARSRRSPAMSR